jgi:hypothetical protein
MIESKSWSTAIAYSCDSAEKSLSISGRSGVKNKQQKSAETCEFSSSRLALSRFTNQMLEAESKKNVDSKLVGLITSSI